MSNEQTLGRESIWLDIHIGSRNRLQKRTLAHIGISADQQRAGVGVNTRQPAQMLPHLLQVHKLILQFTRYRGHTSQPRSLQLFALIQTLPVFNQAHMIPRHSLNQRLRPCQFTQGYPEVVRIVESVHEIAVEGVAVVEFGEAINRGIELFDELFGCEFYFSRVEVADT